MMDLTTLSAILGIFEWWTFPLMGLVVLLIIFWVMYRRKQM